MEAGIGGWEASGRAVASPVGELQPVDARSAKVTGSRGIASLVVIAVPLAVTACTTSIDDVELTMSLTPAWEARIVGAASTLRRWSPLPPKTGESTIEATYTASRGTITGRRSNPGEWHEIARDLTALAEGREGAER